MKYEPDFADKIRDAFRNDSSLEMGLFKVKFPKMKTYPSNNYKLNVPFPKKYYVSSVEIAFRRESIGNLQFYEKMGLGNSMLGCGEDEFFVVSAIKRGKNCRFIDKLIALHPGESTGDISSSGVLRGQGFIMALIYPLSSVVRIPLKAYRLNRRNKSPFFQTLRELSKGFWIQKRDWHSIPAKYRW